MWAMLMKHGWLLQPMGFLVWIVLPDGWSFWHCVAITITIPLTTLGFYSVSRNCGWLVMALGGLLNKICMLANGGFMPVIGYDDLVRERAYKWTVATDDSRLMFLADVYNGASIGDLIATAGLALAIIAWSVRQTRRRKGCRAS